MRRVIWLWGDGKRGMKQRRHNYISIWTEVIKVHCSLWLLSALGSLAIGRSHPTVGLWSRAKLEFNLAACSPHNSSVFVGWHIIAAKAAIINLNAEFLAWLNSAIAQFAFFSSYFTPLMRTPDIVYVSFVKAIANFMNDTVIVTSLMYWG